MTLGGTQAAISSVEQNPGIGFVTSHTVTSQDDSVSSVRIDGFSLERGLNMVYENGRVRGRHT